MMSDRRNPRFWTGAGLALWLLAMAPCARGAAPDAGATAARHDAGAKPSAASATALVWLAAPASSESAWRERWTAEQPLLEGILKLAPGYPKLMKSSDLPGLSGAQAVVLGICPSYRSGFALEALRSLLTVVEARPVTGSDPAGCPLTKGLRRIRDTQTSKVGDGTLSLVQSFAGSPPEHHLLAILRGPKGELVAVDRSKDPIDDPTPEAHPCTIKVTRAPKGFSLQADCSAQSGCKNAGHMSHQVSFTAENGKIAQQASAKMLEPPNCSPN
jgi:hypothetical protein